MEVINPEIANKEIGLGVSCNLALKENYEKLEMPNVLKLSKDDWTSDSHPSSVLSTMYPKGSKKNFRVKSNVSHYYITKLKDIPAK